MQFSLFTKRLVGELRDCVASTENIDRETYQPLLNAVSRLANQLSKNEELLTQTQQPRLLAPLGAGNLLRDDQIIDDSPFEARSRALLKDPLEPLLGE